MPISGSALGRRRKQRYSEGEGFNPESFKRKHWDFSENARIEALFQVAHYNKYYGPASEADVETELGSTESTDKAVVEAKERGEHQFGGEELINRLYNEGLIERTEGGGWLVSAKGEDYLDEQARLMGARDWKVFSVKKYNKEYEGQS